MRSEMHTVVEVSWSGVNRSFIRFTVCGKYGCHSAREQSQSGTSAEEKEMIVDLGWNVWNNLVNSPWDVQGSLRVTRLLLKQGLVNAGVNLVVMWCFHFTETQTSFKSYKEGFVLCWVWVCSISIFYWYTTPTVVRTGGTCSQHVWEESSLSDYRSRFVRIVVGLLDTGTNLWIWPLVTLYVYGRRNKLPKYYSAGSWQWGTSNDIVLDVHLGNRSVFRVNDLKPWQHLFFECTKYLKCALFSVTLYHEQFFKEDTLREPVSPT